MLGRPGRLLLRRPGRLLRRPAGDLPGRHPLNGGLVRRRRRRNGAASGEQVTELPISTGLVPREQNSVRVPGACGHPVAVASRSQATWVVESGEVDMAVAEEVRRQEVDTG